MSFGDRSDALIELLKDLTKSGRQYILVVVAKSEDLV